MSKFLWKSLLAAPAALGAAVAVSGSAVAAEVTTVSEISAADEPVLLAQPVVSVSELTDVAPTDWAFQALTNLVETYGCIAGTDVGGGVREFQGNRSLTRFEFAAGLNACLDVIVGAFAGGINPDDLATIRRLQEEFQAELATIRGRVDALEAETAELRAQQFSTTTKLGAQVDFNLGVPFSTFNAGGFLEDSTSIAARARLNFDASFTGDDRLRIRLQGAEGNFLNPFGGLNNAGDTGNNFEVEIDDFYYSFGLGSRFDITVSATGLVTDDWVTSVIVPFGDNSVADAGGPQFYDVGGSSSNGAGVGFSFALSDNFVIDAGYTAGYEGAGDPAVGIFSASSQSYIGQISFLSGGFDAGFAYIHSDQSTAFEGGAPGAANTFAGLLNFDFGGFYVAGHGAYTDFNGGDDFSWTVGVGFPDLFIEGTELGIYGGQLPQQAGYANNPFLIEGYYTIPFNEFLSITPAIIYGDADFSGGGGNDDSFYGAIRATFSF